MKSPNSESGKTMLKQLTTDLNATLPMIKQLEAQKKRVAPLYRPWISFKQAFTAIQSKLTNGYLRLRVKWVVFGLDEKRGYKGW